MENRKDKEQKIKDELIKIEADSLNKLYQQKESSLKTSCKKKIDSIKTYYETKINEINNSKNQKSKSGLENTVLFYVDIVDEKKKTTFNISSIVPYNTSFDGKTQGFYMGREPAIFEPPIKYFGINEENDIIYVVPLMVGKDSYNFSKDSPDKIKKDVEKFSEGKKTYIIEPQQWEEGLWFHSLWEKKIFNKKE